MNRVAFVNTLVGIAKELNKSKHHNEANILMRVAQHVNREPELFDTHQMNKYKLPTTVSPEDRYLYDDDGLYVGDYSTGREAPPGNYIAPQVSVDRDDHANAFELAQRRDFWNTREPFRNKEHKNQFGDDITDNDSKFPRFKFTKEGICANCHEKSLLHDMSGPGNTGINRDNPWWCKNCSKMYKNFGY